MESLAFDGHVLAMARWAEAIRPERWHRPAASPAPVVYKEGPSA